MVSNHWALLLSGLGRALEEGTKPQDLLLDLPAVAESSFALLAYLCSHTFCSTVEVWRQLTQCIDLSSVVIYVAYN